MTPSAPAPAPVASAAPPAAPAPPPRAPLPPKLGDWIDAYASSYGAAWGESDAFSGYLLVARDGVPIFSKGYGHTRRPGGPLPEATTRFRLASITKQFTGVAILQLVDKGLVREDDPIGKYVPGLAFGDKVTLHHLISHTSGIAEYLREDALATDRPHPHEEVVAGFANKPLAFEPGSRFEYSNSNYFLLGMVLEKVSGQSYDAYVRDHVLAPAGMTQSRSYDASDAPDVALGYQTDGDALVAAKPMDVSLSFAAGALSSTANDMVKWDRALAGDRLLSPAARERRVKPVKAGYAYGVATDTLEGRRIERHGGEVNGFLSDFVRVPEEGLAIVGFSNQENVSLEAIVSAALQMAITGKQVLRAPETPIVPMEAAASARFAGDYTADPASVKQYAGKVPDEALAPFLAIGFLADGSRLTLKNGLGTLPIFQDAKGDLFTKRFGITVKPEGGAKGPLEHLVLAQDGEIPLRYTRTKNKAGSKKK
ncbi:MAG TPA: serine hydrolase domain-containing protein [Polyangiaceae bacterium]